MTTSPDLTQDDRAVLLSLGTTECPACRGIKRERNSFCGSCFHALPTNLQRPLYQDGHGYIAAFRKALAHLQTSGKGAA